MSREPASSFAQGEFHWLARWGSTLFASLFLLIFYWRGFNSWFYQDDFGWLYIKQYVPGIHGFLEMAFGPKAHGNMRPWSENLFFYTLRRLFGINPVPFHVVIFVTVVADLFLLAALVRRITGSRWAAATAQFLWLANPAVATSFCWICIYNETQYLFFILLALLLFMQGRYWTQVGVFILGLGSLELVVMYPFLASLYAWLYDRAKFRRTLPLYAISLAYTALHFWAAPASKSGPYALQLNARMFRTLATYVSLVLGPDLLAHFHWTWPGWIAPAATALLLAVVLAIAVTAPRAAIFSVGWFLLLLAPQLLLPDHINRYVLTGPAMGLAIILGAALASRWRAAAAVIATIYIAFALPAAWDVTTWEYQRSISARDLVLGVVEYNRDHPGKSLLITGIDSSQFGAGLGDRPFLLYDMYNVFLAPDAIRTLQDARIDPMYLLTPEKLRSLFDRHQVAVLDVHDGVIRDVTAQFPAP